MSYGITSTGFARKRLPEIKADLEAALRSSFGDINTAPDSVFGQIIGVFAKASADEWEALEAVYNSMYPSTASGVSLDHAVEMVGVRRLDAEKTKVVLWLTGADGSTVPAGSQATVEETGAVFSTVIGVGISRSQALRLRIVFNSTAAGTYTARINQDLATLVYTTGDLAALLAAQINLLDHPVTATVEEDEIVLSADDDETVFNCIVSAQMSIQDVATPVLAEASVSGPVLALAGTIDTILTPTAGWDSVTNPLDGVTGRNVETDVELRARRRQSLRIIGAASVDAIRAQILQGVSSVRTVKIYENRLPTPDDEDRPGHSFETVIQGGDDDAIALKIWQVKPAGIETFGNTAVIITDSQGDPQAINFSRPVEVRVLVNAEVQVDLQNFPALGGAALRDAVVAFGNSLPVGEDVSVQRFFCPMFAIPGVLAINMTIQRFGEPGTVTDSVLTIGSVEIAAFDADDVVIDPTTASI